ncbi:MAG: BamA/TamA family outer membrane protein [Cyclobacteriaceae bacterium]|nr:BamA/TamA family outer membrane protein [Cyclobacteriaceae bacterium]
MTSYGQKIAYSIEVIDAHYALSKKLEGQADSLKFINLVKSEQNKLLKKGYLLTHIVQFKNDSLFRVKIFTNEIYEWGVFNVQDVPESLLSKAGYSRRQFNHTVINAKEIGKLLVKIIEESDYSGYPFAQAKLDSVIIDKNQLFAKVNYIPGPQIKHAKLELDSTSFVKTEYLAAYLNIKEGELFDSRKIRDISKKIEQLPYAKLDGLPNIKFEHKSCKVKLKLIPVKSNQVDGLIGLAPNQLNKLLVTGYVNLELDNLFKSGKRLVFKWRQFGVQSQSLKAKYSHTNLFKSPIDVSGEFDLFKQDTSFINRNFYLNIGFLQANYSVDFTTSFISSRLLSPTNAAGINDLQLIDFNTRYYGVRFTKQQFDHKINPRKGWRTLASFNVGSKKILTTSFVPAEVYDSLELQALQGTLSITTEMAVPLSKLVVAYSKIEAGTLASNGELFTNDLYRLGGVNSVRGFNELEIYASSYMMLQLESRLLLSENSRLFAFADFAFTDNQVINLTNNYIGIGAGLLLDTPSGVIQLVYAVGKSSKQSLSLAESKIHIGYVAQF